jgi:hypothetical protein
MYGDPDPHRRRTSIFIIFGIIGGALLIGAAIFLWPQRSVATAEGVEAELQRNPALRDTTQALKANYPAEYQALLQRIAAAGRDRGRRAAGDEVGRAMRAFLATKGNALASAPARELQRLAGAQLSLVRALRQENVVACTQFVMNGLRDANRLSQGTVALISRVSVLQVEAARAGERSGLRPRARPSEADVRLWLARIRAIDPVAATDIESESFERASADRQCRGGVALHQALTELPAETAATIMSLLLREAIAQR